jgi:hypothetical protein
VSYFSDNRAKPERFDVRCLHVPTLVDNGAVHVSASATQSAIVKREGSVSILRDGTCKVWFFFLFVCVVTNKIQNKVGSSIVSCSSGADEHVVMVDSEGNVSRYDFSGNPPLTPIVCPDRIAEVSESKFGTLVP